MRLLCRFFVLALVLVAVPLTAAAWEEPDHWPDVGTVSEWLTMDALMYRFEGDLPFLDKSQENVDQQKRYEQTRRYLGTMDAIGLADFLALPPDEQKARADATKKHRDYVVRFRNRMATYVQQTRSQQSIGWGMDVADVTTLGDLLRHMRSATGVDPANPYNWHLYSTFAYIAGDLERAALALRGAEAALAEVPEGELKDLRMAVALDRAWLERERGDFAASKEALDQAVAHGADGFDVILLEGLIAALSGDTQLALDMATKLSTVQISKFPYEYRSTSFSPEISNMGAWRKADSNFAQAWITALTWIKDGNLEMARSTFGNYKPVDVYPQSWRFWNDAGAIYEITGRPRQAGEAWNAARMWRPYAPYFPLKITAADIGRLTGRRGQVPVFKAYDTHIIAGSQLAFGFMLVMEVHGDPTDMEMQAAAGRALEALEVPRKAGVYAAQAHILEGTVYYRMGDKQSAFFEMEKALDLLAAEGNDLVYQNLIDDLASVQLSRSEAEIEEFLSQSGTLDARWVSPEDPVAYGEKLAAAYAADPSAENRHALAYNEIRYGDPAEGLKLVADHTSENMMDLKLALQADRARNDSARAVALAGDLAASGKDLYGDAELWTLVGFICLDAGEHAIGKRALVQALELDPTNHALQVQMEMLNK